MTQTTNNVFNSSLFHLITPNSLLAWQRVRLAHSLAHTGEEWAKTFSRYNSGEWSTDTWFKTISSKQTYKTKQLKQRWNVWLVLILLGTYNNQYMVVDRSKVKLSYSIDYGALTVVEQIPGLVEYSDQTEALRRGNSWFIILLFSTIFLSFVLDLVFLTASVYHRLLAILQHSLPQKDLHAEWVRRNVAEVWRWLLIRSLSQSQDLPSRPGQCQGPGLFEAYHEVQRWGALSQFISFQSSWCHCCI